MQNHSARYQAVLSVNDEQKIATLHIWSVTGNKTVIHQVNTGTINTDTYEVKSVQCRGYGLRGRCGQTIQYKG